LSVCLVSVRLLERIREHAHACSDAAAPSSWRTLPRCSSTAPQYPRCASRPMGCGLRVSPSTTAAAKKISCMRVGHCRSHRRARLDWTSAAEPAALQCHRCCVLPSAAASEDGLAALFSAHGSAVTEHSTFTHAVALNAVALSATAAHLAWYTLQQGGLGNAAPTCNVEEVKHTDSDVGHATWATQRTTCDVQRTTCIACARPRQAGEVR
jgi:hypothetical protein